MARRRRKAASTGWIQLLSALPWPVSVTLGITAFFGFNRFAQWPVSPPKPGIDALGDQLAAAGLAGAAMVLQYAVPALFAAAALSAWLRVRRRRNLIAAAADPSSRAPLLSLSWKDFEELTAELFRRRGYSAQLSKAGADGGVDVVLRKQGEVFLVQCKHWKATKIGVDVVRSLFGLVAAQGATGGFVVTAGDFTKDAMTFARGRNIELVHANDLLALLNTQKAVSSHQAPTCPNCSAPMVSRTSTKGANKGRSFFGCSNFPDCRGVLPA